MIQSPNYPEYYPHSKQCGYLISQPLGSVVALQFLDFQIETHYRCAYDYVEVSALAEPRKRNRYQPLVH